ncbi:MAG: alpha/beta hydrolase [Patescibacteria group bacterium]|nr:alpha/beta hydrolase [Patescibacteria group bacterium]
MKNALILHGTNSNSSANWFPWLKKELEKLRYKVWVPNLPFSEKPNIQRYNNFIFSNKDWEFDNDSVIIGHSSGAVEILGLLEALPNTTTVDKCILVGSFMNNLGWDSLKELFLKPFDFKQIKKHAKEFVFIHSDNDPYCPLEHAKYLSKQLGGKLIVKKGQGHFSGKNVRIQAILDELCKIK